MILGLYTVVVAITIWALVRYFRGRTVENLIRRPPEGSDLNAVVRTLSYIEHELIKHRIPVIRSLMAKSTWNDDDRALLERTLGHGEDSLLAEYQGYLGGIQRGAGRTLVNFRRDRAFHHAERRLVSIQRSGERWLRADELMTPPERERAEVDGWCAWLAKDYRRYLVEMRRSVYRCDITLQRVSAAARRGLAEATQAVELTLDDPPDDCAARVLGSDLDVVVRNLVRNAAQATHSQNRAGGGRPARIHIEVCEEIEDTGEESVLLRVHDSSPRLLSRNEIYGREAQRGLGLVTAALARHRGALRCVSSSRTGFAKAMEVRLERSLHEPDASALTVGRARVSTYSIPLAAAAVHALLLSLVIVPYFVARPIDVTALSVSDGCSLDAAGDPLSVQLTCSLFAENLQPRSSPIRLDLGRGALRSLRLHEVGASCARATLDEGAVRIDLGQCLRLGELEPELRLDLGSLWSQRRCRVEVRVQAPTARYLTAVRRASDGGDFALAKTLIGFLLDQPLTRLANRERFELVYWSGRAALVHGIDQRTRDGPATGSPDLCELADRVAQVAEQLGSLAQEAPAEIRDDWLSRARYLLAQSRLWLTTDRARAVDLLRAVARDPRSPAAAQNARMFLILLALERGHQAELRMTLAEMLSTYRRPSMDGGGGLTLDLVGAALLFDEPLVAPVPEVLCAVRALYPDYLASDLSAALALTCHQRPVDPRVETYVATTAERLHRLEAESGCAE